MDDLPDTNARESLGRLTLRTLGAATFMRVPPSDEDLPAGTSKQFALVAFLACRPQRSAIRDEVISPLWPGTGGSDAPPQPTTTNRGTRPERRVFGSGAVRDSSVTRANAAFRNALEVLRSKLGADAFGQHGTDPLQLTIPLDVDYNELVAASARRDDATVVSLYAGPFLPRLELLKAPTAFAEWIEKERAYTRRLFLQSATRLSKGADASRTQSVAVAQQLIRVEEIDDDTWIAVLSSLSKHSAGEECEAVSERLLRLLADREAEPSQALTSVVSPKLRSLYRPS